MLSPTWAFAMGEPLPHPAHSESLQKARTQSLSTEQLPGVGITHVGWHPMRQAARMEIRATGLDMVV